MMRWRCRRAGSGAAGRTVRGAEAGPAHHGRAGEFKRGASGPGILTEGSFATDTHTRHHGSVRGCERMLVSAIASPRSSYPFGRAGIAAPEKRQSGVLSVSGRTSPVASPSSARTGSSGISSTRQHSDVGHHIVEIGVNRDPIGAEVRVSSRTVYCHTGRSLPPPIRAVTAWPNAYGMAATI